MMQFPRYLPSPSSIAVRRVLRNVLATLTTALAALSSFAQPGAMIGGPGGAPFADRPAERVWLGAVALRSGEVVDAIAAVVVPASGNGRPLQSHGGSGGAVHQFALNEGERMVGMRVWAGQFVEAIQFETNRRLSPVFGTAKGAPRRLTVPQGFEAVGFIGRAGLYVDAIGFALQGQGPPSPTPQGPGMGPPSAGAPPGIAPPPAPAVGRVELDGPVRSRANGNALTLNVRLKRPALLTVNLSLDAPRNGQCFGPEDRGVLRWTSQRSDISHAATFDGLQRGNTYHYSIPIDGGRCVHERVGTQGCIEGC